MKEELYNAILSDSDCCYKLSAKLLKDGKEVPSELIESISQDTFNSQCLCQIWIRFKKESPPDILIKKILDSDDYLHIFKLFFSFINEWKLTNDEEDLFLIPNKKIINKCINMLEKLLDNPKSNV